MAILDGNTTGPEKTIDLGTPGYFFGEIGILHNIARTASVKALTPVQVFYTKADNFQKLLNKSKSFAEFIKQLSITRLLKKVPNFIQLDLLQLNQIRELLTKKSLKKGDPLFHAGDKSSSLYLISSGSAAIPSSGGVIEAGEYAGIEGFFEDALQTADVYMSEDGEVYSLSREDLLRLSEKRPMAIEPPLKKSLFRKIKPFLTEKSAYLVIPDVSMNHPRRVLWSLVITTVLLVMLAALPSIWPNQFNLLHPLEVDTDPENMLSADDPARVIHNQLKQEMNIYDLMVVGVVNHSHPDGIYNVASLARVHELTEFAKTIRWKENDAMAGVIDVDIMSPSTVDDIGQEGPGTIRFSWLMPDPPKNREEAMAVRQKIERLPLMDSALAARDGKALALYLPLTSKDVSYRVYQELLDKIATFEGDEAYHITGLPVAEDSFGVEMFIQMAVSAPLAMLVIFLLMYFFFRNLTLISAPMIIAMVSVMITMSLLVISGQTIHIMSSMIPIFIMPIAVLDSVHILSEFFDYYPKIKDRRLTMKHVVNELFVPMFYTSVTTALGFASLAMVPIPPVQVFGIFVAIGVVLAWFLSISFIPAYIFLVKRERIVRLLATRNTTGANETVRVKKFLHFLHQFSAVRARFIVFSAILLIAGFLYGISIIVVNDNPIRWFDDDHLISVADKTLNQHFAGTYMAYLAFSGKDRGNQSLQSGWQQQIKQFAGDYEISAATLNTLKQPLAEGLDAGESLSQLENRLEDILDQEDLTVDVEDFIDELYGWLDEQRAKFQIFRQPDMLLYLEGLQEHLQKLDVIGKTVSIGDFVKTVNRELHEANPEYYRIPDTFPAVSQSLLTYQNSHRPQDLWRFITTDARQGIVWLLLNSGDNVDMTSVLESVDAYILDNPPPYDLDRQWFGLNYINVIWQEKMVNGMLLSIIGSYLAVMLIMVFLLRSVWWGLLAMLPLTVTLVVIYGLLGLMGKSYDMPVAVLSALTIGLAIDFSIHFSLRMRHLFSQTEDWRRALQLFFEEPARALMRNLMVVAIGFTPLLLAPLVPYNTVGYLIASILLVSGIVTLLILPAVFNLSPKMFFAGSDGRRTTVFGRAEALFSAVIAAAFVMVVLTPLLPLRDSWPLYLLLAILIVFKIRPYLNSGQSLKG